MPNAAFGGGGYDQMRVWGIVADSVKEISRDRRLGLKPEAELQAGFMASPIVVVAPVVPVDCGQREWEGQAPWKAPDIVPDEAVWNGFLYGRDVDGGVSVRPTLGK